MNRRRLARATLGATIALALLALSACTSLGRVNDALRVTGSVVQLPLARAELFDYLETDELVDIGPELQYLDSTYTDALRVLEEHPEVTLADIVLATLGTPDRIDSIRLAYLVVERAVADHAEATGEAVPMTLRAFGEGTRAQYAALQRALAAADESGEVVDLLRLLRPLALALL